MAGSSSDRRAAADQATSPDQGAGPPPTRPAGRTWALRLGGLLLAGVVYLALGASTLGGDARVVAAIVTLMAVWWMTEAIPLAATALLPLVLVPPLTGLSIDEAAVPYADPIVFLFLGGFLIAIAMQKWNLHRRIALLTLRQVGTHPRRIVLGMMIATAFLSMWVSNTATTLMMLPIGISVLALVVESATAGREPVAETGEGTRATEDELHEQMAQGRNVSDIVADDDVRVFGVSLMLAIAWSASIGGLGTLLGSPPNAIVAGYLSDEVGQDIAFVDWLILGLPLVVVFILVAWLLITRVLFRSGLEEIPGGRELIDGQIADLGPMSRGEKVVLAVFVSAAFFWIVPGLLANIGSLGETAPWLDAVDDTVVAIAAGLVLFLLPADADHRMALTWEDAEKGLPWGVLLLFGGGLSLAAAVAGTGLDEWFGEQVSGLEVLPTVLILACVCALVLLLTEVTSNTATAATFIPVLGGVAVGIGVEPVTLLFPAALAATCAFMLPVGTPPNAIVFGTGAVTIQEMARGGAVLNVVGVVLITLFTVILGPVALGIAL